MRIVLIGLMLPFPIGCVDMDEVLSTKREQPATPPGIASVEDVAAGGQAAERRAPAAGQPVAPQPVSARPDVPRAPRNAGQEKSSIVGQKTREIVDARQALQEPDVVIVQSQRSGPDPLTQIGSTYVRAASFAGSLPLKQMIQHHRALNGRPPTYEELMDWMRQNPNVELPALSPGQRYGYDSEAGEIVVLGKKRQ